MDAAERAEPTEPTDSTEPTDPIDSTEPTDPVDRIESLEQRERQDLSCGGGTTPSVTRAVLRRCCRRVRQHLRVAWSSGQMTPCASIASATRSKPAMFAPVT